MQTSPEIYSSSVTQASLRIFREEGITAFWKGAVPTAIGMALENAMAFGVNEGLKRSFAQNDRQGSLQTIVQPFAMGALTGCCSALVLLPSEIVKAKLQVVIGANVTQQQILSQMMKKQGLKSLFVGLDAQLARDATFYALFFGGYELFVYGFRQFIPGMPDELNYFISGGLAGMAGWAMAMPLDVPKTNVQARYDTKVWGSYSPEFTKIFRERGIRGLYSGLGPTLIRAFPANAALFLGVETSKKLFDRYVWEE